MNVFVVEGWTEPIPLQLLLDGLPFDGTGSSITAILQGKLGRGGINTSIPATWTDSTTSKAQFVPAADTFIAAQTPYTLRIQLVDSLGAVSFFPQADPDYVVVGAP